MRWYACAGQGGRLVPITTCMCLQLRAWCRGHMLGKHIVCQKSQAQVGSSATKQTRPARAPSASPMHIGCA